MRILRLLAVLGAALSMALAQPPKGMTARELFYTAPAVAKPAAAAAKPAAPAKQVASAPKPVKPARAKEPKQETAVAQRSTEELPGGARLTNASSTAMAPLGLRYTVLKYMGDNDYMEVDPEITFRSGEKIRLRVQSNEDAYLYVVMQGSSGTWRVMFPNEEFDGGSNRVLAGKTYDVPARTRLVFDEQPGLEKLFIVLSRKPETEVDKLIYSLESRGGTDPKKPKEQQTLMASAALGDSVVRGLRDGVMARDLVFEKVDDSKPAPAASGGMKETAVYVVNASGDPRLVADIQLRHR